MATNTPHHIEPPDPPKGSYQQMNTWLVSTGIRPIVWVLGIGVLLAWGMAWIGSIAFANALIDAHLQHEQ